MASAVIGIQLVTRVAVGSGTTRKESSSELSVTLKIHLEGRKDNRSACNGFQTRFLFPHRNVAGGGEGGGEERFVAQYAIHQSFCLSSTSHTRTKARTS